MPIRTLTPTSLAPSGSKPVAVGGDLTWAGVLADDDDTSYIYSDAANSALFTAMSTFTIPSNEYVSFVDQQLRFACSSAAVNPRVTIRPAIGNAGSEARGRVTTLTAKLTNQTWTSPRWLSPYQAGITGRASGVPWSQSDINYVANVITPAQASGRMYMFRTLVRVGTVTKPAAVVSVANTDATRPIFTVGQVDRWEAAVTTKALTSNVATLTTSTGHGFQVGNTVVVAGVGAPFDGSWTIATVPTSTTFTFAVTASNVTSTGATGTAEVGDSKQFSAVELRVFTAAQVSAAGFSVTAATPVWQYRGGFAARSVDVVTGCGVDLVSGVSYRVYARTTVVDHVYGAGASTIATDWVSADFTEAFLVASGAAVSAAWNSGTQSVDLQVTTRGNLVPPAFASAESVVGGWSTSGCTVARVADAGVSGGYVTEVTASGGVSAVITLPWASGVGVSGGERYLLKVPVKAVTETRAVSALITWRDGAGASVGTTSVPAVSPTTAQGWGPYLTVNVVAPAGAATYDLAITVAGPPAASAKWRFDGLLLVLAHSPTDDPAAVGYGQGGAGAGLSDFRVLVERSVDGGTTWAQVRAPAGTDQTVDGIAGQRWSGTDHEVPRGLTAAYRAALVALAPATLTSPSGVTTVTTTPDGAWWAKAVTTPALNVGRVAVLADPEFATEESVAVLRPIGRAYPVVVAGPMGGRDGSAVIATRTAAEAEAVEALLRHQGVVLLQSPFVSAAGVCLQVWVRVTSRAWPLKGTPDAPRREFAVSWVDVGCPEVGL